MIASAGGSPLIEPPIRILLLGPPEIYINAKPVTIKRRLNRALLYYLAVQRHPVSRDELSVLFWPEESDATARKNLRESLSRIRTELGVKDLLITNDEQISLNPDLVTVDAIEVDDLLAPLLGSSEMTTNSIIPDWMVMQIRTAVALCRTNRFLQGFYLPDSSAYENWMAYHNQAFYYTLAKIFDRMVDHSVSEGNLEEAILWLSKALELDPLDEDHNYLMLICLRDTGRNQQLIDYVGYLEKLYQQKQISQKFTEMKKQAVESKSIPTISGSAWPVDEKGEPRFVGRADELEMLSRLLRRRGLVTVEGEAGIGKTRLIKQFFEQQSFSPRLFYTRGFSQATRVMFFPIFSSMNHQLQDEEWQQLDPLDQQRLSHFYHSILQAPGGPSIPKTESEWLPIRADIYFSFMKLLKIAAAHKPLLFILDDAQFLDSASLSLITFLLERGFFEKHGLLVVTYSPEVENLPLEMMLQRARREKRLDTIQLAPLTAQDISKFIEDVVGVKPGDNAVKIMQRMSGGNPNFLTECVRAARWTIQSRKAVLNPEECSIPDSVAAMVMDKVHGLEPESAKLIKAAAILGRKFCPDVLEEMTGFDSSMIAASIEELIREGFLLVNQEIHPLGGYEFKHDVEREYLVRNLTPSQQRDLHLKAARALKKLRGDFPKFAEDLAHHWEVSLNHVEAVNAWLDAGRYARLKYLKEATYRVYLKALDLIVKAPTIFSEKVIYAVVNEFGNYAYEHDDMPTCEQVYRDCLFVGETKQNRNLIGTAYNGLAMVAYYGDKYEEAERYANRASWHLEGSGMHAEILKKTMLLGSIQYNLDNFIESRETMEKALAAVTDVNEPYLAEIKIEIITVLCIDLCYLGEPARALELAQEMVNLSSLATRRSTALQANAVLAICEYFCDHLQRAVEIYQESLPLVEKFQIRFWQSLLEVAAALAYLEMGNLDKAWYLADRAYERQIPHKSEKLSMHVTKALGDLYRSIGNTDKAMEYYLENINSGAKNFQTTISKYYMGVTLIDAGQKREGQKWVDEAILDAGAKGFKGIEATMTMGRLFFGARKKLSANVRRNVYKTLERLRGLDNPQISFFETAARGFQAESNGDLEEALALYKQTVLPTFTHGNVWLELLGLDRILQLVSPDSVEGKAAVRRINEIFDKMQQNATYPQVKRDFQKLRAKWRKNVNVVSTHRVYK